MKPSCGCFVLAYIFASVMTAIVAGWSMWIGTSPVTFMNCIAFVWMPFVAFAALLVAISPIIALAWVLKILF